ncbi:hypothetical protein REPUB_Repub18cG0045500 [Reevesia pubescens]
MKNAIKTAVAELLPVLVSRLLESDSTAERTMDVDGGGSSLASKLRSLSSESFVQLLAAIFKIVQSKISKRSQGLSIIKMEESVKAEVDQEECMESGRSSETFRNKIKEAEAVEGGAIWDIFWRQEAESFDADYFEETPARTQSASKRRPNNGHRLAKVDGVDSIRRLGSHALKACKIEEDLSADNGYTTFALFASLLDYALQGLMPIPDLILQFERSCQNVSELIRFGSINFFGGLLVAS